MFTKAFSIGHNDKTFSLTDSFIENAEKGLLTRAAWVDGIGFGVKVVTIFPKNNLLDVPSVNGVMVLFDRRFGKVLAMIDSALITKWKTASDSLLGAQLLARPESKKLLVIGAGKVAESIVEAYGSVFEHLEVTLWNRTMKNAESLRNRLSGRFKIQVAEELSGAVFEADLIVCATMSQDPILRGKWLRPGQHVDLIGAYSDKMREADDEVLLRSEVFVDCFDSTLDCIGEIKLPIQKGVIKKSEILGDLTDLVSKKVGRSSSEAITVYKNGGGAHLDLMAAEVILRAYKSLN